MEGQSSKKSTSWPLQVLGTALRIGGIGSRSLEKAPGDSTRPLALTALDRTGLLAFRRDPAGGFGCLRPWAGARVGTDTLTFGATL